MKRARVNLRLQFWRLAVALSHHLAGPWVGLTQWCDAKLEAAERMAFGDKYNREDDDDGA